MVWYQNQETLRSLCEDPARQDWLDWEAGQSFSSIEKKLPSEMRDRTRIGGLLFAESPGLEGLQSWMQPIDGHKKLLSPRSSMALFDASGALLFQGAWEAVPFEHVRNRPKCYVWLEPRHSDAASIPWKLKVLGAFRLMRHRLFKK